MKWPVYFRQVGVSYFRFVKIELEFLVVGMDVLTARLYELRPSRWTLLLHQSNI